MATNARPITMDIEKNVDKIGHVDDDFSSGDIPLAQGKVSKYQDSFLSAFAPSSFRRNANITQTFDKDGRPLPTTEAPLARRLKKRHLQMIAIGGSIGTHDSGLNS